jgi:hypothetical protein
VIEIVADELLSAGASMQKPNDVTEMRHISAVIS